MGSRKGINDRILSFIHSIEIMEEKAEGDKNKWHRGGEEKERDTKKPIG